MNKEVLRDVWHGQLPLCFKLHPDDINVVSTPQPYYMMVSRVTYFPLIIDRVVKYFYRFMDQSKQAVNEMWIDYDGQALKWQHPIGLSWDLLGSRYNLPWVLILHFSDFPTKELVRCNTKSSIETYFMSTLKEADALKHKGAVIKNMVKKDHNLLWSSLVNDKFEQFWSVNKRLMDKTDNTLFRFIPFRLYFPDYTYIQRTLKPCTTVPGIFRYDTSKKPASGRGHFVLPTVFEYDNEIVINQSHKCSHQNLVKDENDEPDHRLTTLLDLIQASFTNKINDLLLAPTANDKKSTIDDDDEEESNETTALEHKVSSTTLDNSSSSSSSPPTQQQPPSPPPQPSSSSQPSRIPSESELIDVEQFKYRFITHGIEIPFDTPLQWLSEHFSYPDNFLHICAVLKDTTSYM